jgi:hypothetical protein
VGDPDGSGLVHQRRPVVGATVKVGEQPAGAEDQRAQGEREHLVGGGKGGGGNGERFLDVAHPEFQRGRYPGGDGGPFVVGGRRGLPDVLETGTIIALDVGHQRPTDADQGDRRRMPGVGQL